MALTAKETIELASGLDLWAVRIVRDSEEDWESITDQDEAALEVVRHNFMTLAEELRGAEFATTLLETKCEALALGKALEAVEATLGHIDDIRHFLKVGAGALALVEAVATRDPVKVGETAKALHALIMELDPEAN